MVEIAHGGKYADIYPHVNGFQSAGARPRFLNNRVMSANEKNRLIERIDQEIAARGSSREAISIKAKLSRDFLRKLESRGPHASVRESSLRRLAEALEIPYSRLIEDEPAPQDTPPLRGEAQPARKPRTKTDFATTPVPVLGTASGAVTNGFELTNDIIDFARRPPALMGIDDAYAIYVTSDSMQPLHKPGDLCFVHPGRPCLPGDSVIVQMRPNTCSAVEAYIKTYVKTESDWVVTRQYNPVGEVKFARSSVFKMHHVMTMRELFGM